MGEQGDGSVGWRIGGWRDSRRVGRWVSGSVDG